MVDSLKIYCELSNIYLKIGNICMAIEHTENALDIAMNMRKIRELCSCPSIDTAESACADQECLELGRFPGE